MSVFGLSVEWKIGPNSGPDTMQRLSVAFERAGAELVDLGRHVFPLLPDIFESAIERQFDSRGSGPVWGSWEPLNPVYAKWKAKHFPGMQLMERRGALREGLTKAGSAFGSREWTATTFVFGTRGVPYASAHQYGTDTLPVRALFDFDAQFQRDLAVTARKGVNAAIKAAQLDDFVGTIPEDAS